MINLAEPVLSPELVRIIDRAHALHDFVINELPEDFADTDKNILTVGLYSLAEEHHRAILFLLGTGRFDGSAFALARPLIDAAFRAHWVYSCAEPEDVKKIVEGKDCYPKLEDLANQAGKRLSQPEMLDSLKPYIRSLHGFTHGGVEQLHFRFDKDGNVRPSYTDSDRAGLISLATLHFIGISIAWSQLALGPNQNSMIAAEAINAKYLEFRANR